MLLADMAVCCIGILLALKMNDIIRVLSMGYSLMASGCLVPFLGGVIWKKGTSRGALYSAFAGMAVSLAASLELIRLPYASISSILISAAVSVSYTHLRNDSNYRNCINTLFCSNGRDWMDGPQQGQQL